MLDQETSNLIEQVRRAYRNRNLTLYLGAGVSVGNGLPSWDKLVLAMYFSAIKRNGPVEVTRPFPNYLFAIAEWHLERRKEPLDITARKIRNLYSDETVFLDKLHETLYAGFIPPDGINIQLPYLETLLEANPTLEAVAKLCSKRGNSNHRAIQSVITYNYDNLLEIALGGEGIQSIWQANQRLETGVLPIYHVHGYVPMEGSRSNPEDIVFTEEQYHLAAQNAYSWSNLTQIKHLSSSVGLMIGLSLTDRNMRRLLDALKRTPLPPDNYALLQKPQWIKPDQTDIKLIDQKANQYYDKFIKSGLKTDSKKYTQIKEIIEGVEKSDFYEHQLILKELGVNPIWYTDHTEVPAIIKSIISE